MATVTQPAIDTPLGAAGLPRRLGRYVLEKEIARGGMGTVYRARAEGPGGLSRIVAVKTVSPELAETPRLVDMFLDEARIASRIVHPNVATAFDFGEADGVYFLAMDYLDGVPLSRVAEALRDRPERRSARFAAVLARIAADAAEGLHAAHELSDATGAPLGVVHRDVSPDNVFVTRDGAVRVIDFGIAAARDKLYVTTTGELKGTVSYMAPEQLGGGQVDRRADVWGLGVVMWELLTGKPLFTRESSAATVRAVASAPIPLASDVSPHVPPALAAIVARALCRDPSGRYDTARDMGRELVRFIATDPVGAADVAELVGALFPDRPASAPQVSSASLSPAPSTGPPTSRQRSSVQPWLIGVVALIVFLAVGLFIGRALRPDGSPGAQETAAPS